MIITLNISDTGDLQISADQQLTEDVLVGILIASITAIKGDSNDKPTPETGTNETSS